ncbi:leucine-rich repeat-containing protein 4 [Clonorchis sinensis]|uniref:Leucine-rich repeat-containing protein 4 n=1 Tax=Clonorchis sinensis TaxID=79923 RepID=H2KTY7_CLOSI|nr:leucine-rich repeat-containing protein 4 [Clonorchis sinensis]
MVVLLTTKIYLSVTLSVFLFILRIPLLRAVRGCVTYVTGEDYSKRQSICDKPDTHFTTIPSDLPSQVVKLTINHQDIPILNASQFRHLLNLTDLDLDSNNLRVIRPSTFKQLRFLQTLSLRFNLLTFTPESFHPEVIQGLPKLEYLNLYQNPIGFVPSQFFSSMGSTLRSLVLAGATSGDFHLDPAALNGLHQLQVLDLSSNNMNTLPETFENSFTSMKLKELYLYDNPLRCDCQLRWLKVWFLKHGAKLTYSKRIPEGLRQSIAEPTVQIWSGPEFSATEEKNKLFEPKCVEPYELFGRPIFNQLSDSGPNSVRITDFQCSPQALSSNQPVQLSQGYNSTLSCEFFADPAGIVVWYRNGTRIQSHWPRMSVQQTQGRKFHSTLIIENVQLEDAGMYVCFLDTGHGRANTTFTVHVEPEKSNLGHMLSGSVFQWMNQLNTTLVLKYTGIAASCLIILLMFTGLIIYCLYGKRSCRHHEELQSSGKTDGLRKSSYDSLRDGHLTEKPNGKQIYPDNAPLGLDKQVRMPRSTLVSKSAIGSVDPKVFVSVSTSSDQPSGHLQVISTTEPVDNYLAIQLVPTEGKIEGPKTCSIHNYAIIQSVKPDGLLLHGVPSASTTHAEGTLFESDRRVEDLTQNNASRFLTSPRMIRSTAEDYNFGSVRSSVAGMPTQLASSVDYVPCPLHGNIYATLQCTKKDTIAASKKHIATIPKGLGTVSERRTNTIPHRGKAITGFTSSESGTVQANPVSSFISAPEIAKSKAED